MKKTIKTIEIIKEIALTENKLTIGIDPDLKKSGFCVVTTGRMRKKKVEIATCLSFYELLEALLLISEICKEYKIIIEAGWLNKVKNFHNHKNTSISARIGANVGENHAVGKLIQEYCEYKEISYTLLRPSSSKWNSNMLKMVTSYDKQTNQEERDAIKIAYIES